MNSIAHISRSNRQVRAAQVAYDNLEPEDFQPPEPPELDYDAYVDDWCGGNLAELPGQDIYAAPSERLTEDEWRVQLLAAKNDEELLQAAKIVKAKLYEFVAEQADEK